MLTVPYLEGDTCTPVLNQYNYITKEQFFEWNPALQGNCDGLWAGYWYCVANFSSESLPMPPTVTAAPSPVQTGIASNCVAWYQMNLADTCDTITAMFGTFTSPDFIKWNPAVWTDCSNIQVGHHSYIPYILALADQKTYLGGLLLLCCSSRHTENTHVTSRISRTASNDQFVGFSGPSNSKSCRGIAISTKIEARPSQNLIDYIIPRET